MTPIPYSAAAAAALLVAAIAISSPAAACKWKKAGHHGYRTADAGAVVGYKHGKYWKHRKHWKHRMIK
ncbi:MAG: hypothetical protein K8F92_02190 [Hyphomicrobium sp.]|uniref:hypothetical protein n=1 Tax=Hyphomicrobium sp. TaxID=82 RepID=UPI0013213EFF|nr:hypothetical protein [Hyphomicrobium sp.]KAB2941189.1 MAG: hypothetical protein F9K20_10245 [Hyphomicrobium sp.]MBZ0208450.1 hypothetical protein [Hyphomicrobium sp.]